MGLIYGSDSVKDTDFSFMGRVYSMNSVHHYATHFNNFLYLRFIINNDKSTAIEKMQAKKEISIASRKCDLWRRVAKSQERIPDLLRREQTIRKQWGERT